MKLQETSAPDIPAQNTLVIMADEHSPKMLGCAGHALVQTPHFDALAARGTRFARAYTPCPICVPARAAFATGRYVHELGFWDNSMGYDGRVQGWGHRLQAAGIRNESIGKLHYRHETDPVGLDKQYIPMHIKDGVGMVHLSIRRQYPDFIPTIKSSGIIAAAGCGESEYTRYDRKVAKLACEWLAEAAKREERWVLFVSFVAPHFPLVAPEEFFSLYPVADMPLPKAGVGSDFRPHPWLADFIRTTAADQHSAQQHRTAAAAYLGLCSFVDAQIGLVLEALQQHGLAGSTRVIYTSDHGENAGARMLWGKSNHYEESSGIPLIIAGDGIPNRVSHTPVNLIDVHPTILHSTGLAHGTDGTPGTSLIALAAADDDPDRVAFSEYHAARSPSASFMVRKGRYKLIHYVGFAPELFDLDTDPEEQNDRAASPNHQGVLRDLERCLREIVDPQAVDRAANAAQKALVDSRGGPAAVMANLVTTKAYTPVPGEFLRE
ncbi:MAG: sulfatase-like hydrolase/transferase [Gammaproteobacteria bacterium]|nr:sulfatase-like hydrolase/transferase [Gammaproteobacteria bacterium]